MHFNTRRGDKEEEYFIDANRYNNFLSVDTLKIDDHLRLRFSKRTRKMLPVQAGDELAVFQRKKDNVMIVNLQRDGHVVDIWILKRLSEIEKHDYQTSLPHAPNILDRNYEVPIMEHYEIPKDYGPNVVPERPNGSPYPPSTNHTNYQTTFGDNSTKLKYDRSVMIIDDESDIAMSFSEMLKKNGIKCDSFTKPADALLRFTEKSPSHYGLVIVDIKMPGLNGLELYKIMKAQRKNTRFLFVSALDYAPEFLHMLRDPDAKNFLTKPVDEATLIKKVNDLL
jgi:CheY-like chemotaxis protein